MSQEKQWHKKLEEFLKQEKKIKENIEQFVNTGLPYLEKHIAKLKSQSWKEFSEQIKPYYELLLRQNWYSEENLLDKDIREKLSTEEKYENIVNQIYQIVVLGNTFAAKAGHFADFVIMKNNYDNSNLKEQIEIALKKCKEIHHDEKKFYKENSSCDYPLGYLNDTLILPVQTTGRYGLYFDELSKLISKEESLKRDLIEKINEVCRSVKESTKKANKKIKKVQLKGSGSPNKVSTSMQSRKRRSNKDIDLAAFTVGYMLQLIARYKSMPINSKNDELLVAKVPPALIERFVSKILNLFFKRPVNFKEKFDQILFQFCEDIRPYRDWVLQKWCYLISDFFRQNEIPNDLKNILQVFNNDIEAKNFCYKFIIQYLTYIFLGCNENLFNKRLIIDAILDELDRLYWSSVDEIEANIATMAIDELNKAQNIVEFLIHRIRSFIVKAGIVPEFVKIRHGHFYQALQRAANFLGQLINGENITVDVWDEWTKPGFTIAHQNSSAESVANKNIASLIASNDPSSPVVPKLDHARTSFLSPYKTIKKNKRSPDLVVKLIGILEDNFGVSKPAKKGWNYTAEQIANLVEDYRANSEELDDNELCNRLQNIIKRGDKTNIKFFSDIGNAITNFKEEYKDSSISEDSARKSQTVIAKNENVYAAFTKVTSIDDETYRMIANLFRVADFYFDNSSGQVIVKKHNEKKRWQPILSRLIRNVLKLYKNDAVFIRERVISEVKQAIHLINKDKLRGGNRSRLVGTLRELIATNNNLSYSGKKLPTSLISNEISVEDAKQYIKDHNYNLDDPNILLARIFKVLDYYCNNHRSRIYLSEINNNKDEANAELLPFAKPISDDVYKKVCNLRQFLLRAKDGKLNISSIVDATDKLNRYILEDYNILEGDKILANELSKVSSAYGGASSFKRNIPSMPVEITESVDNKQSSEYVNSLYSNQKASWDQRDDDSIIILANMILASSYYKCDPYWQGREKQHSIDSKVKDYTNRNKRWCKEADDIAQFAMMLYTTRPAFAKDRALLYIKDIATSINNNNILFWGGKNSRLKNTLLNIYSYFDKNSSKRNTSTDKVLPRNILNFTLDKKQAEDVVLTYILQKVTECLLNYVNKISSRFFSTSASKKTAITKIIDEFSRICTLSLLERKKIIDGAGGVQNYIIQKIKLNTQVAEVFNQIYAKDEFSQVLFGEKASVVAFLSAITTEKSAIIANKLKG